MDLDLVHRFDALRAQRRLDVTGAAVELKVPEARLFAAHIGPDRVRLNNDWSTLLEGLIDLGPLVFHTDGRLGIHRIEAKLDRVRTSASSAILQGDTAELRLLLSRWHSAWAVMHDDDGFAEIGVHIHDRHGDPVLRIVQGMRTDRRALQRLVAKLRMPRQDAPVPLITPPSLPSTPAVQPDLRRALQASWPHLSGSRDLSALLRRHGLRRPDAYALVAPLYAQPVSIDFLGRLVDEVVRSELMVAVSLGNRACIQTHRGILDLASRPGRWLTVGDPALFIHFDTSIIESAWVVRRPGRGGTHMLVELLGAGGDLLGGIRSTRSEDQQECRRWRRVVGSTLEKGAFEKS